MKPFNPGTNPTHHNLSAKRDKQLDQMVLGAFRITSEKGRISRKRKKHIYKVERANYRAMIVALAKHLAEKAAREQEKS